MITILFSFIISYMIVSLLLNTYIESLKQEIKTLKNKLHECNQERYFGRKR